MKKYHAFSLIELLVVISIIALLLSILLPSLNRVKLQARKVICKSNLKQWGAIWTLYGEDNDGKFPHIYYDSAGQRWERGAWIIPIREYYQSKEKIVLCPTATKPNPAYLNPDGTYPIQSVGDVRYAYKMRPPTPEQIAAGMNEGDEWCSYGMNNWCSNSSPYQSKDHWQKFINVNSPSEVPLMLDSLWRGGRPSADDYRSIRPPQYEHTPERWIGVNYDISHFCLPRHPKGLINLIYIDMSVSDIKMKELWTQQWYEDFDRSYASNHIEWPEWMNKYD